MVVGVGGQVELTTINLPGRTTVRRRLFGSFIRSTRRAAGDSPTVVVLVATAVISGLWSPARGWPSHAISAVSFSLWHDPAAVDVDRRTGDIGSAISNEKCHRACYFLGLGHPSDGYLF